MMPHGRKSERGVALVVTVIVVAMLAVVAVAMMQSTTVDRLSSRSVANHYRAQLAAEAGLAEAMALIQANTADFGYASGSEPQASGYRTYIQPRSVVNGVWQRSGPSVYLDSGVGGEMAELLVSGTNAADGVVACVSFKNLSSNSFTTNRFAFWVDDGSGKQNLSWWGGSSASRGLVTNIADLPLALPSADGISATPMPGSAVTALTNSRRYFTNTTNLFGQTTIVVSASNQLTTPATLNVMDPGLEGRASRYFYTLFSPSSAASPAGRGKLNLVQLARYLKSGISSAQGAGQPRAKIVDWLLQSNPPEATNWGGGDLNWLATAGKYSTDEQKQIVANLIDYLDNDLIPTTDSIDSPTYFGVEMKVDSSGQIMGHPVINFVTAGMIFNRNKNGLVNSTRLVCSLGLVFPWSSTSVSTSAYEPEINIAVEGSVLNGIPEIGSQAGPYFFTKDFDGEMTSRPVATFAPFSGNNWPQTVGLAGASSYSHGPSPFGFYGFTSIPQGWPTQGPVNMTFQNARYLFKKLRLRYTPTGGGASGYVQILPTNVTIDVLPTSLVAGGGSGSLQVKFSAGGQYANTANLYLASDPRANFKSSSWANLPSITTFGTSIPEPVAGAGAVNLSAGVGPDWDGAQGLPMDFNWFNSVSITNHLNRFASSTLQSIGEIGYLWTGKPWQTLNLMRTNNPSTVDHNLLDYLAGGFSDGSMAYPAMPIMGLGSKTKHIAKGKLTAANSLLQDGGFNVLSRKLSTATAYLTDAPEVLDAAPSILAALPPPTSPSLGGALAAMTNLSASTATKFGGEAIVRAMANGAVTQSRVFTVYSRGEYISAGVRSQALIEADVFVDVDPSTGAPLLKLLSKKFL